MKYLYSPKGLEKLKLKFRILSVIALIIAAAALVTFVVMCQKTGTLNAMKMENYATLVIIVVGWIEIYLICNGIIGTKRELKHATLLLTDEEEIFEGEITVTKQYMRIKDSVTVQKVDLKTQSGVKRLNIIDNKVKLLPTSEKNIRLAVVHGYISGFEVENESN